MILDINYTEIALIRELVQKHREEMFHNLFKNNPKARKMSFDKICEGKKEFDSERNPFCPEGQCGIILDKIDEIDDKIKAAIG